MKRKITSLTTAIIVLFLILFTLPGTVWATTDQVTSQTATNNGEYVIAIYYNGDYYALPGASTITNSNTYSGIKLTLNTLGKVNTSDAAGITWKLVEGTTSGQFKIQQTTDNTTKYLVKSGTTGSSNYKINTSTTAELWEFTQQSNTYHTYSVKSLKSGATVNLYLTNSSSTFGAYGSTNSYITLLAVGDAQAFTVTLADDNSTLPEASAGAGVTLPSRSDVSPYTFAGWSSISCGSQETTNAPASIIPAGTYHPTANVTLYPVYKRVDSSSSTTAWYETALADADEGVYALLTPDGNAFDGSISSGNGGATTNAFSFNNGVASQAPSGVCEITFTAVKNNNNVVLGYKMYNSGSNKGYLYASKASSGGLAWHDSEDNYWHQVTYSNVANWEYSQSYSGSYARLRTYNSTFRTYSANTNGDLKLAKKVTTYTTYYISVVSTGTPTITASNVEILYNATGGSIGYSITDEPETPGTLTAAIKAGTTSTITNLSINNNNITNTEVPFTCGANNDLSAHTATVTLTYTYGNDETVTKDVTITQAAHPTPSITAANVEINYNSIGGNIAYTINDGIEGGSVSASVPNNSWITLPNTFASPIVFTCEATEGVVARTETVTLTYTFNSNQSVAKEVTVTQGVDATLGTADHPYTVAQARTFIDGLNGQTSADGKHVSGIISQVDSYSSQYNSITYWISDDGTTTNQLQVYSGKGLNGANFSAETDVAVGAEVVVKGKLKYHNNTTYEFDYNNELVSYTAPVVPNPTITIAAGLENYITTDPEDDAAAGTTVQIGIFPPDNQVLRTLTVTKANEETLDVSPAVSGLVTDYTFNMPASNVTISATFVDESTTTTILYSVNGVDNEVMLYTTVGYELPDLESSQIPEGFDFAGWTLDGTATTIELLDDKYVPENNDILTAVFSREEGAIPGDFTLVTSEPSDWSGNYLIAYDDETFADGRVGGTDGIGKQNESVNPGDNLSNGVVSGTWGNTYCVTLEKYVNNNETYYLLKTKDGKYNYRSSNSNGLDATENKSTAANYPLSVSLVLDNSVYYVDISISAGAVFHYNTDGFFRFYKDGKQSKVQLYKQGSGTPGIIKYYSRIIPSNPIVEGDITITGPTVIENGTVLNMGGHTLTCIDPANLIIEDGAQLICSNSVAATFKKTMPTPAAPSTKDDPVDVYGWELISSPVHDDNGSTIAVTNVTNLTTSTYDMFAYDEENSKWINQKATLEPLTFAFDKMYAGQGYMYRNNAQELSFVGNTNVNDVEVSLTYTAGAGDLAGFHLVGNPYTENITLMNTTLYDGTGPLDTQLSAYYILKDNGSSWKTDLAANTPIANKQGFLIQIPEEATKIQFSRTARTAKSHGDNIKFMVANSQFEDVTYALFDKALPLNKINHRNPEVPMIYINQNDQDYAVATMTDDTKAFGLNFKAATAGKYTLSYKATGNYNYLHIIDRLTGADVDMLLEGEYSFIGTPKDSENRFIVHLEYMPNYGEDDNDIFAYQSGSDIYVSGQGELQVFDVTGRRVMTTTINGAESISIPAQGVYIFKLNEKVQKIVVR